MKGLYCLWTTFEESSEILRKWLEIFKNVTIRPLYVYVMYKQNNAQGRIDHRSHAQSQLKHL